MPLTDSERHRHYRRTAEDLASFDMTVTFYDESEMVGEEEDGSPVIFAEVIHDRYGVITQRPARELAAFAWGIQWRTITAMKKAGLEV